MRPTGALGTLPMHTICYYHGSPCPSSPSQRVRKIRATWADKNPNLGALQGYPTKIFYFSSIFNCKKTDFWKLEQKLHIR